MGSLIVCAKTRTCFDRPGAMAVDLTFCSQQLHVVSICIFLLFFRFRLNVYKAIGNQKILTPAGGSQLMCKDTLKVMFGCRTRAYLQPGTTGTPGEGTPAEQGLGETFKGQVACQIKQIIALLWDSASRTYILLCFYWLLSLTRT